VLETLPKVLFTGEGRLLAGDTARFRKGLFEGKLVVSPSEICVPGSVVTNGMLVNVRRVLWAGERFSWPILYLHETRCVDKLGNGNAVRAVVACRSAYLMPEMNCRLTHLQVAHAAV